MNDQRLYIDDVLVDMDESTKITMDIKSNLFRDISNIASNTTFTVKLPKTVRNQQIMGHADLVQSDDDYPYKLHIARYYRNGVEVIQNGRAVVLSSGESIEISIVWGLYPVLSNLISSGTTLNKLNTDDRIVWTGNNTIATYEDALKANYFYAGMNAWKTKEVEEYWNYSNAIYQSGNSNNFGGDGYHKASSYIHPSVKISYMLQLIKEQTGIDFNFSGDEKKWIDSLIVPLVSKKANGLTFEEKFACSIGSMTGPTMGAIKINITSSSNLFSETSGEQSTLTSIADAKIHVDAVAKAVYDMTNYTHKGTKGWVYYPCYLAMIQKSGDTTSIWRIGMSKGTQVKSNFADYPSNKIEDTMTANGVIKIEQGDIISFAVYYVVGSGFGVPANNQATSPEGWNPTTTFEGATINISAAGDDDTVPKGGYFPITYNFPEIKIIDLIKFLAAMTGTFPVQITENNVVVFEPFGLLWSNKDKAKDWTRRVIASGNDNKPDTIEYTISDYAQNNYYRWKEDATVLGDYDGMLSIDNKSLEKERTVITFPFAASDGSTVPMYTENTSSTDSDPEYSECKDRIMRLVDDGSGNAKATFDINLQSILDEKYGNLYSTLQRAKIIKEKMRIRDIEILNFDETMPVYLAQYGSYFAITEIKSEDNGLAEVTMIQLTINL